MPNEQPDAQPTLSDLFDLREDTQVAQPAARASTLGVELVGIASDVTGVVAPPGAGKDIFEHLRSVLTPTVGTILANAWNKREEIRKYADPSKYPPGKISYVALAPHDVKWTAVPTVRISINETVNHTLEFTFDGKFHIEGAELKIDNARILSLRTGKSWFEGKLTFRKLELIKRKSEEYVFPGEIALGDGIRIPAKNRE